MASPAVRVQVRLGATSVTYLPDGFGVFDRAVSFPASEPGDWARHADCLDADGRLVMSFGAFLIRTGAHRIMVDLGMGPVDLDIPGVGRVRGGDLLSSLAQEGLGPADIDTVVFTHLHPDHVGWTGRPMQAGDDGAGPGVVGLTFGGARHLVGAAEWHYWSGGSRPGGPDPLTVMNRLAGRIELLRDRDELAPGVHVRATPGHTPGHLCVVVTDPAATTAQRVVITGDLMHTAAQVVRDDWQFFADVDGERARTTRTAMVAELDDAAVTVAAGHFTGQVFGHIRGSARGRDWVPLARPGTVPAGEDPTTEPVTAAGKIT
jgi:glyoxylase-like metal-dependent hydrolase (beta-lactamase superfamily II)